MGKKCRNDAYNGPQLLLENLDLNNSFKWTKAVVLSTVASFFDPSGLISAYVIKYKLFLREVSLDKKIGWSDPLPTALMNRWRSLTKELVCIPPIIIDRCAQPPNAFGRPRLAVFSDGSSVAYAAFIYYIFKVHKDEAGP